MIDGGTKFEITVTRLERANSVEKKVSTGGCLLPMKKKVGGGPKKGGVQRVGVLVKNKKGRRNTALKRAPYVGVYTKVAGGEEIESA